MENNYDIVNIRSHVDGSSLKSYILYMDTSINDVVSNIACDIRSIIFEERFKNHESQIVRLPKSTEYVYITRMHRTKLLHIDARGGNLKHLDLSDKTVHSLEIINDTDVRIKIFNEADILLRLDSLDQIESLSIRYINREFFCDAKSHVHLPIEIYKFNKLRYLKTDYYLIHYAIKYSEYPLISIFKNIDELHLYTAFYHEIHFILPVNRYIADELTNLKKLTMMTLIYHNIHLGNLQTTDMTIYVCTGSRHKSIINDNRDDAYDKFNYGALRNLRIYFTQGFTLEMNSLNDVNWVPYPFERDRHLAGKINLLISKAVNLDFLELVNCPTWIRPIIKCNPRLLTIRNRNIVNMNLDILHSFIDDESSERLYDDLSTEYMETEDISNVMDLIVIGGSPKKLKIIDDSPSGWVSRHGVYKFEELDIVNPLNVISHLQYMTCLKRFKSRESLESLDAVKLIKELPKGCQYELLVNDEKIIDIKT